MNNGPDLWKWLLSKMPMDTLIAGGAVRDFLTGKPNRDIDVWIPFKLANPVTFYFAPDDCLVEQDHNGEQYINNMRGIDKVVKCTIRDPDGDMHAVDFIMLNEKRWYRPHLQRPKKGALPFDGVNLTRGFDMGICRAWFSCGLLGGKIGKSKKFTNDVENLHITIYKNENKSVDRAIDLVNRAYGEYEIRAEWH